MKKRRAFFWGCFIVLLTLLILFISILQYRHFYQVGDVVFTFWKTTSGCYIMPYKYRGLTIPKNNYMKAVNVGGAVISVGEDSTLYIFPNNTYELGAGTIEINLTLYMYEYYPYMNKLDDIRLFYNKIDYYKDSNYPYINIYIREMSAEIGDKVSSRMYGGKKREILMNILQMITIGVLKKK